MRKRGRGRRWRYLLCITENISSPVPCPIPHLPPSHFCCKGWAKDCGCQLCAHFPISGPNKHISLVRIGFSCFKNLMTVISLTPKHRGNNTRFIEKSACLRILCYFGNSCSDFSLSWEVTYWEKMTRIIYAWTAEEEENGGGGGGVILFHWCCRTWKWLESQICPYCEDFCSAWMSWYSHCKIHCQFWWSRYLRPFFQCGSLYLKEKELTWTFCAKRCGFLLVFNSSGKQSGSVKALSWQDWYNPIRRSNTSNLQNQMCHPAFFWQICVSWGGLGGLDL